MAEPFAPLLALAQQVTPALRGESTPLAAPALTPGSDNRALLRQLHSSLRAANPEAGDPWWTARSWGLLCWQPLYLALLSVYGLQQLPASFARLSQRVSPALVAGFYLPPDRIISLPHVKLVEHSCAQLKEMLTGLHCQLAEICKLPAGLANRLLADQLLITMVRLQALKPELTLTQLRDEAALWLQSLQLPLDGVNRLQLAGDQGTIYYQRQSCCMVYRCTGSELCSSCPRLRKRAA